MATIVDPREELAEIESRLARTKAEHSRLALAAIGRPEFIGDLDRLVREINRDTAQIEAIKNFAGSEAADRLDQQKRDAEARRQSDAAAFAACLEKANDLAKVIESGLPFDQIGELIAQMHDQLGEACSLWLGQVDEKNEIRTANRSDNIRQMLGTSGAGNNPVVAYLEVAAYRQNLIQTAPPTISMFPPGRTLFDVVSARTSQALEQSTREFSSPRG